MIEAEIPQDILRHKTKFIGNFSLRETLWGGGGIIAGLLGYLVLFDGLPGFFRTLATVLITLPCLLIGFMKVYNEPIEKMVSVIFLDNLLYPPKRLYKTELNVQAKTVKEVKPSRKYKGVA